MQVMKFLHFELPYRWNEFSSRRYLWVPQDQYYYDSAFTW